MALRQQIYSFSQWQIIHEDLNFLTTDVQLVEKELLLETSGRRCFRFLDGSDRKSPRLRAKEGNCIILQSLVGGRRYLARTSVGSKATPSSTSRCNYGDINRFKSSNRKEQQSHDHFKFLVLDDSLPYPKNTEVIFEWLLTSNGQCYGGAPRVIDTEPSCSQRGSSVASIPHDTRRLSQVVWTSHPIAHFESYVSCRKRFVIVVGPPCLNYTQKEEQREGEKREEEGMTNEDFYQPSNCIFDAEDLSMKVFRLRSAGDRLNQWSANVTFDPRPFREHVAAVVASSVTFNYLPRFGQTGSLLILDVSRQRVLHARHDRLFFSTDLQYTCTGEQLLTSLWHDDVIASRSMTSPSEETVNFGRRPSHFALLSSDDLTLIRLISLSPMSTPMTPVLSSLLSRDFRNFAIFLRGSEDACGMLQSSSLDARWPIQVVNFCFPAEVDSLFHICLGIVRKLVPRKELVDSLQIPKVFASHLKERWDTPIC